MKLRQQSERIMMVCFCQQWTSERSGPADGEQRNTPASRIPIWPFMTLIVETKRCRPLQSDTSLRTTVDPAKNKLG